MGLTYKESNFEKYQMMTYLETSLSENSKDHVVPVFSQGDVLSIALNVLVRILDVSHALQYMLLFSLHWCMLYGCAAVTWIQITLIC